MVIPQKWNIELPYDPLLGTHSKELEAGTQKRFLRINVHSSIIHNNQKVETTQMSINRWMDKQKMVYTYNGILFSLKHEWNSDTCYNMDEPWGHYAKGNKARHKKTNIVGFHLYEVPRIIKFIEIENRRITRG